MTGRLAGKVAVVTGAAAGMGAAEATAFAREGAVVVLADIDDARGRSLAAELGGRAEYRHLDTGDEDGWRELVSAVETGHGRLDVLVNNAAISLPGSLEDLSLDDFDAQMRVNQRGVVLGMRAVIEPMRRAGGGSIINVASAATLRSMTGFIGYSGTKHAVRGMSRVAAQELAGDSIRVNVIHPGVIDTPMNERNSLERQDMLREMIPMRRFGLADEVAAATVFLACDESSYVTGADLAIDGGVSL